MRLIIFVKIPERAELIPLDIMDDRPSQAVLEDILALTKIAKRNEHIANYSLLNNREKINLNLDLTKNNVKNGDCLHLIELTEPNNSTSSQNKINEVKVQEIPSDSTVKTTDKKKASKDQKSDEPLPVPGKKIDFD